jgi:hypothetical protein
MRLKPVVPPDLVLLSAGEAEIDTPFEGFVESTLRV